MITGCTAGVGEQLVYQLLALRPRKVLLVCRDRARGQRVQEAVTSQGIMSQLLFANLEKPKEVLAVAREVLTSGEPLHLLVSNVGVWRALSSERRLQEDGLEEHFATNFLAMVLLCTELRPLLERCSPSRIVITGCFLAWMLTKGVIDFDNLQGERRTSGSNGPQSVAFAQSKLLQCVWAKQFAPRLRGCALLVFDPGMVETELEAYRFLQAKLRRCYSCTLRCLRTRRPDIGARPGLWCCDAPEAAASKEGRYVDWGTFGRPRPHLPCELGFFPSFNKHAPAAEEEQARQLYDSTEQLCVSLVAKYGGAGCEYMGGDAATASGFNDVREGIATPNAAGMTSDRWLRDSPAVSHASDGRGGVDAGAGTPSPPGGALRNDDPQVPLPATEGQLPAVQSSFPHNALHF
eukprot:NODE_6264_length_1687_cov_5.757692.p1 GENE.NODE_6264_length_1687_cov_5.757692~~NODE_6264_length_1687_cov_5.757692.p1  ORF type:complete len:472 (-),score=154.97 NODE_6264_length_1687_cov_5.757692:272-1489(-)